ncbi:MAG: UDP-N-acetylmuramate dehydrogenase [bacterium]
MIADVATTRAEGIEAIARTLGARALRDEPLSRHTSFRIGGPADIYVRPDTIDDIRFVLRTARECGLPVLPLGGGSNIVVRDGGVRGVVIRMMKNFDEMTVLGDGRVRARAGVTSAGLAFRMAELGLGGIEFAVGIPGTVGGGVITNAGAHGGDWGKLIESVEGITADGEPAHLSHDDLDFRYRHSAVPAGFVVTEATLRLEPGDAAKILATTRGYLEDRRAKQPLNYPNAGCFFKNPAGAHAGQLIESAGLKGFRVGDLEVSEKHANFIVNLGGGTARDALALVAEIRDRVHRAHGVWVETEVMVVGEEA